MIIQDNVFLENRDRAYSENYYILDGIFSMSDMELDLRQFAAFIEGDIIYIEFHHTTMVERIGRKLMPGDVFCLPSMIDRDLLDPDAPAIMKYYVVDDASRAADGYSPTWFSHIWRCKCKPMTDSQEYRDITDRQYEDSNGDYSSGGDTLRDIMSTGNALNDIMQSINDEARTLWSRHGYEQRHLYFPKHGKGFGLAEIWTGAGAPDDSIRVREGTSWPTDPIMNEYFLRTDWNPAILYQNTPTGWIQIPVRFRYSVYNANSNAVSFINNNELSDKQLIKQDIKYVVKPKADF